jgi:hypothetical protein
MRVSDSSPDEQPGKPKVTSITVTSQHIRKDGTWKITYQKTIKHEDES